MILYSILKDSITAIKDICEWSFMCSMEILFKWNIRKTESRSQDLRCLKKLSVWSRLSGEFYVIKRTMWTTFFVLTILKIKQSDLLFHWKSIDIGNTFFAIYRIYALLLIFHITLTFSHPNRMSNQCAYKIQNRAIFSIDQLIKFIGLDTHSFIHVISNENSPKKSAFILLSTLRFKTKHLFKMGFKKKNEMDHNYGDCTIIFSWKKKIDLIQDLMIVTYFQFLLNGVMNTYFFFFVDLTWYLKKI